DQFVASEPSFLWEPSVEHARIDPSNPEVMLPHLRCAAAELAFGGSGANDIWSGLSREDLQAGLEYLAEHGGLLRHDFDGAPGSDAVFVTPAGVNPSEHVELRGSIEENFSVLDDCSGNVLAQVDFEDAPLYLHVGAIYPVEGRFYEVRQLDWEARKAYVRAVHAE